MTTMLPFNPECSTSHLFEITLQNPDKTAQDSEFKFTIYSYIKEEYIIAAIVRAYTKYSFTIANSPYRSPDEASKSDKNVWSINQTIGYLRRLRFIRRSVVRRYKTISWNEVIEEEL